MSTSFENIYHGLGTEIGELLIAASGLGWKSSTTDKRVTVAAAEIKWVQWLRVARNFQLRILLNNNRRRVTFDGFLREDHDKLARLVQQHFNQTMDTKEISFKGWNWGATDIQGSDLAFLVSNKTSFEIPLGAIQNSNIAGKTEVSLEFSSELNPQSSSSNKKKSAGDELVEMRLYVPGTHARDMEEDEDGNRLVPDDDADGETSAAQAFHDMIKEKADLGQVTGEGVASFSEVTVLTPRGRYDIEMFPTFLRLRGKTYDYKIVYTSITRLFLLPRPDDVHIAFVIGLDPPIRQGQTRYPYLVMHFSRDEEVEMELALDEETIQTQYAGKLKKRYEQPIHEVISAVFRGLSDKKITAPSKDFTSRDSHNSIKANLKAAQGDLYFLDKSLLFLGKPTTLIEYTDMQSVVFSRVGGGMASAKTFDLKIIPKSGPEVTFTGINKEEHERVDSFLKDKKLRIKNEMNDDVLMATAGALLDDDDDDDDDSDVEMRSVGSEDAPPKKARVPGGGGGGGAGGGLDDDESEDEDFQASSSDAGSPSSASDSDSDAAADDSDASGDREMLTSAAPKKKKVKKADGEGGDASDKPKKKKVAKKDGAGAMDDGNPRPKKKVKKAKDDE